MFNFAAAFPKISLERFKLTPSSHHSPAHTPYSLEQCLTLSFIGHAGSLAGKTLCISCLWATQAGRMWSLPSYGTSSALEVGDMLALSWVPKYSSRNIEGQPKDVYQEQPLLGLGSEDADSGKMGAWRLANSMAIPSCIMVLNRGVCRKGLIDLQLINCFPFDAFPTWVTSVLHHLINHVFVCSSDTSVPVPFFHRNRLETMPRRAHR
jgi:hypothetical protein